jgi:prepilin-type N-terminal cleavage/methylation domain-containing protein
VNRAFTLIELLVVIALVAVLSALALPALKRMRTSSSRAISAHTLKQLITAGHAYLADHENRFWKFREDSPEGTMFWFGWETMESRRRKEGERELDASKGPLGPYIITSGGIKIDPAFLEYEPRLKPKYSNGNYGYGYNSLLELRNALQAARPAEVVVFATSAQVNTFQSPASAQDPMIEEFYMINEKEVTVHFRHGGKALCAFLEGSVREMPMDETTRDQRMPKADVGRFAPAGSTKFLW